MVTLPVGCRALTIRIGARRVVRCGRIGAGPALVVGGDAVPGPGEAVQVLEMVGDGGVGVGEAVGDDVDRSMAVEDRLQLLDAVHGVDVGVDHGPHPFGGALHRIQQVAWHGVFGGDGGGRRKQEQPDGGQDHGEPAAAARRTHDGGTGGAQLAADFDEVALGGLRRHLDAEAGESVVEVGGHGVLSAGSVGEDAATPADSTRACSESTGNSCRRKRRTSLREMMLGPE